MRIKRVVTLFLCFAFVAMALFAAQPARNRALQPAPLNLGDSNADLVYTPLSPCRIIDTRLAGGFMSGGTTRSFIVKGTAGFDAQGGNAAGCGVPTSATSVLINFVAVSPDGVGNLKGSSYPDPIPATGSIINYQLLNPGLNVANAVAFPVCDTATHASCPFDITLFTNGGGTHVVADVLGYFKRFPTEQTITSIVPGTGLTGGGTSGAVTLGIAAGGVGAASVNSSEVQLRVTGACADGAITSISSTGMVTCSGGTSPNRVFTTGTTLLTVPAGITKLVVNAWGGGGGGAGYTNAAPMFLGGGGGGGGGYLHAVVPVTPGDSITITVGAGGQGGMIASSGQNGNASIISSGGTQLVIALGGGGSISTEGALGGNASAPGGTLLEAFTGQTGGSSISGNGAPGGPSGMGGGVVGMGGAGGGFSSTTGANGNNGLILVTMNP